MGGENHKGGVGQRSRDVKIVVGAPPSSSSSDQRQSRWESSKPSPNKPTPKFNPIPTPTPNPNPNPPPRPIYGFQMLDRRSIALADGSVRSYFALPPDYQDFPPLPPFGVGPRLPPLGPMSPDGFPPEGFRPLGVGSGPEFTLKRKFATFLEDDKEREEYARQKQQLLQYGGAGKGTGTGTSSPFSREVKVDPGVMKAFLHFAKVINENGTHRKNYLDNGKHGPLHCLACGRSSKDFLDVHSLIMHMYTSDKADSRVDHLGLHRALCVLMGWNYTMPPDNSRSYQFLPGDEAAANQDDLIMWPPMVIIHNTNTGKGKDGRMEGLGNKAMDSKIRDLGISGGKSKSLYSKDGHLGITLIKFAGDQSGFKEAMRLADHFANERHGRRDWAHIQSIGIAGRNDENNPNLVMIDERTGERRRVLYGYLLTASDLDKVDYETRKKTVIESKNEKLKAQK